MTRCIWASSRTPEATTSVVSTEPEATRDLDGVRLTLVDRPVGDERVERAPCLHEETRRHAGVGSAAAASVAGLSVTDAAPALELPPPAAAMPAPPASSATASRPAMAAAAPPPRSAWNQHVYLLVGGADTLVRRSPITFAHPPEAALKDTASSADLQLATGIIGS